MKKAFIILLLIFSTQIYSQSKTYNLDQKKDSVSYTQTKDFAIYHGEKLPVFISKKGKIFIFVTSKKTGNQYKKYLN